MNDAVKGLTLGAADYLVKPVDRGRRRQSVTRLLDGQRPARADGAGGGRRARHRGADPRHAAAEGLPHPGRARRAPGAGGDRAQKARSRDPGHHDAGDDRLRGPGGPGPRPDDRRHPRAGPDGARTSESDARRGLALGAKRYISKPFDVRALITEVRRHARRTQASRRARSSEPMKKKILVVDDEDDILHFLELVLQREGLRRRDRLQRPRGADHGPDRAARPRAARHHDAADGRLGGAEAAARGRRDRRTSRWPCSPRAPRPRTACRACRKAPIDYICKPFSLQELLGKIETIFAS